MAKENLTKAKYSEFQASLWGAMLIAFALGVFLAGYFQQFALVILLVGIIVHSWGMYKVHQRNK